MRSLAEASRRRRRWRLPLTFLPWQVLQVAVSFHERNESETVCTGRARWAGWRRPRWLRASPITTAVQNFGGIDDAPGRCMSGLPVRQSCEVATRLLPTGGPCRLRCDGARGVAFQGKNTESAPPCEARKAPRQDCGCFRHAELSHLAPRSVKRRGRRRRGRHVMLPPSPAHLALRMSGTAARCHRLPPARSGNAGGGRHARFEQHGTLRRDSRNTALTSSRPSGPMMNGTRRHGRAVHQWRPRSAGGVGESELGSATVST